MKFGVPSAPGLADALRAVFFSSPCTVGMYLHAGAVEAQGLDPDPDHLLPLQGLEHAVQNAVLRPPVHARVDSVPVSEVLRQATPLAAVLGHLQNGVEYLQVREADIAPLPRQQRRNELVLYPGEFHLPVPPHCFY